MARWSWSSSSCVRVEALLDGAFQLGERAAPFGIGVCEFVDHGQVSRREHPTIEVDEAVEDRLKAGAQRDRRAEQQKIVIGQRVDVRRRLLDVGDERLEGRCRNRWSSARVQPSFEGSGPEVRDETSKSSAYRTEDDAVDEAVERRSPALGATLFSVDTFSVSYADDGSDSTAHDYSDDDARR
jgi:hypothetical protein